MRLALSAHDRYYPADMTEASPHIGSSFESFLDQKAAPEKWTTTKIPRVSIRQLKHHKRKGILTKSTTPINFKRALLGRYTVHWKYLLDNS